MTTFTSFASMKQYAVNSNNIKGGISFRNLLTSTPSVLTTQLSTPSFIEEDKFLTVENEQKIGCLNLTLLPGKK